MMKVNMGCKRAYLYVHGREIATLKTAIQKPNLGVARDIQG